MYGPRCSASYYRSWETYSVTCVLAVMATACKDSLTCSVLSLCACVSAWLRNHLTRLSRYNSSDFPKNDTMNLHWRASLVLPEHLPWRQWEHTQTHTYIQNTGSRLQTHNPTTVSFCYTVLHHTFYFFTFSTSLCLSPQPTYLWTAVYFRSSVPAKYWLRRVEHINCRPALRQDACWLKHGGEWV